MTVEQLIKKIKDEIAFHHQCGNTGCSLSGDILEHINEWEEDQSSGSKIDGDF
jgi:hypothetical protein